MSRLQLHPMARREIREAAVYYDDQEQHLAREFLEEIDTALDFLLEHPRIAQRIHGLARALVLPRFPYKLIYLPLDGGGIRLLAVAHQKRRPGYWLWRS